MEKSILVDGIWYGEKTALLQKFVLQEKLEKEKNEWEKLKCILELFKLGDFSVKPIFQKIMRETQDEFVSLACLRIFYLVSDGSDLEVLSDLIDKDNEEVINAIAIYAPTLLSLNVVPYLIALIENFSETVIEENSRDAIDIILNDYEFASDSPVEELADAYFDKLDNIEINKFHYKGEVVTIDNLNNELLHSLKYCQAKKYELNSIRVPYLLSAWSGIPCPVKYHEIVGDEMLSKVIAYTKDIKNMNFKNGNKYFYGHNLVVPKIFLF